MHTRHVCRRTARVSIIEGMAFVSPIGDMFCGADMDNMEYDMAKGHDALTVSLQGNTIAK